MKLEKNSIEKKKSLADVSDCLLYAIKKIQEKNVRYVFLGNYYDLPFFYTGNDIDILVDDIESALQAFKEAGFLIRKHNNAEFRAFLFSKHLREWTAIDVETKISHAKYDHQILDHCIEYFQEVSKFQLRIAPPAGLVAYKTAKYLIHGLVHSEHQVKKLKQMWLELSYEERETARSLLRIESLCDPVKKWVVHVATCTDVSDSKTIVDDDFQQYIISRRKRRHARRVVFQGTINKSGLLRSWHIILGLLRTLMFGKRTHPWPAIAIVGNDGCGKSVLCQRLKDRLYKVDPLHIVMRANEGWLPLWGRYRSRYSAMLRKLRNAPCSSPFVWVGAWVGELLDFLDKLLRYKFGMAWAHAGFGFVIFERYVTDRLRGEYPGPKYSLFPLEQFFPFPHVFVLLDVTEEDSLKRKPRDGHTYQEMAEKRANYVRLIQEIKPHVLISADLSLDEIELQLSEIIWDYASRMQLSDSNTHHDLAVWKPVKRERDESHKRRKQKDAFL